ncbi:hypothetical protein BC828DRAFT_373312 [Blastocladiella britannica]|nr:hypothetical protein BC828DRAFT_373312 [Blastocladiella britannica]
MLDAAAPVLLINANGPPLLTGVEPAIVDDLTDCPLNLLKYPTLISHVVARIDHAIGAEAFEGLYKAVPHNYGALNVTSPYTRAPVLGCIPFGSVAQHVRLGSWVARKLMTGGRVLGNPHLWLAAIYFVVRDHMPRLAEHGALMDAFRTHLAHRLTAYETNIALSGLATYPLVNVPVGVALWYVVAGSTALFAMDAEQFEQERLRQFWSVARYMRALVEDVIGWPVMDAAAPRVAGLDAVERRAITLRVFSALMARKQDMSLLRQDLRRLYQNHLILSRLRKGGKRPVSDEDATVVVMTDGPCAPELAAASPFAWMRDLLPLPTILRLGTLVAPNAKVGSVLLDDAAIFSDCRAKVAAVTHYGYDYARSSADDLGDPKVCPATMRLWTYDARDHPKSPELWSDRASRVLGAPVDRFLSAYNYFIEYVANHRAYPPTQADFIAHMAAREAARTSRPARDTLPENVEIMARIVVANYKAAFAARGGGIPTPTEFTKLMEGSRTKSQRRAIETAWVREVGNQAACAIVVKGVTALSSGSSSVPSSDQVVGT